MDGINPTSKAQTAYPPAADFPDAIDGNSSRNAIQGGASERTCLASVIFGQSFVGETMEPPRHGIFFNLAIPHPRFQLSDFVTGGRMMGSKTSPIGHFAVFN